MKKCAEIITALCWTVFILCVAVVLALNLSFLYKQAIRKNDLVAVSGLSEEALLNNYHTLVDYCNLGGDDTLELPDYTLSDAAKLHFADVSALFHKVEIATIVFGVLVLVLTLSLNKLKWYRYRFIGSMVTLILPVAAGILILLFWDKLFLGFHKLLFGSTYWAFDPETDPIIQILPDSFFRNSAFLIVEITIIGAVCLASANRRVRPLSPEEQVYLDEKTKLLEERQKKYDAEQAKRKELKKGKRLGKHDFNLTEKANQKLKDL